MSIAAKQHTFLSACREFFGLKPDQQPIGFLKEVKELTDSDKAEIQAGLVKMGYNIQPTPAAIQVK